MQVAAAALLFILTNSGSGAIFQVASAQLCFLVLAYNQYHTVSIIIF